MKDKIFCYATNKREIKKKNFIDLIKFYKSILPKDIKFYILDLSKFTSDPGRFADRSLPRIKGVKSGGICA